MGEKLRKSGIDIIGNVPWGTHFCQFYRKKEDLMEILVPYFTAGLENNEFCLWITSHPLEVEEAKEALRGAVPDIDIYLGNGQIEIIPCNYWYVKDEIFDSKRVLNSWIEKLDQAMANGYDGLRLSGDTFWLEEKDWDSFVDYEEEIDNLIGNYRMIALCTYSLDRCSTTGIIDVVTNHQFALVKKEGKWKQVGSSKRRRAEEEALQAAKSWKYTFDAVPDLIAIIDDKYRIVRANKAMTARLGMAPEECVGLTCYRVMHGTDGPPSSCPHQHLLKDELEHAAEVHEDALGGDFIVSVSPLHDSKGKLTGCIHVARDITERKRVEEALYQSEQRVRLKLESILSPDKEMSNLELVDIVDAQAIQSLMDDFYKFAHITMALVDLKGNVLVGIGWQDICTKFHRIHPEACKHCIESDTKLSAGVSPGEFKLYKCKNNMWDIATPLIVGGQHVGNIFSGQFFFEDETVDYELFRSQAKKYGFNEEEYIAALEKVPRMSPKVMDTSMAFLAKLAHMISRLSYSNIKLAQSLAKREALVDALRESEEKYRNIVETANEGIWVIDAEDRTTYVNNKMAEMLGYSPEEMIGRLEWDFINEKEKAASRLNVEEKRRGIEENYEFKFIRKDGSPLWTLVNTRSFFDKQGKFTGSMGMLTDITKRKEVEEALIRSEKEFRTLAENAPDMIARFDRQNHHMYVNPAVAEIYGLSQEEIIGKTRGELGLNPEKVKSWKEHHQNVFATREPKTMEFKYISAQGKKYYFNTRTVPEFIDGEVVSVLDISRDITDIKEAEAALKETLNNLEELVKARTSELEEAYKSLEESEKGLAEAQKMAHIGNWDWDLVTGEVNWSEELYRIFRRNPQEPGATHKELLNYIHPDDRDYVDNAIKKRLNGKAHGIDYRIILADGEELTVHAESEVIFDEKNFPVRAKGIVQDITERKKAEKALANFEAIRKKEIHHRIKNNLQVISSLLDLQAEKFNNRECVKDSEIVEAFRESQDRVISIALIHEELHEGEGTDTLNFSQYLQRLVENLFETYRFGNAEISLNMDLEENIFFDMDTAVPLGMIVNELVSNSFKHAFPGRKSGEINIKLHMEENKKSEDSRIECENKECKNTSYTLIVSDNGIGIPESVSLENSSTLGIQLVTILVDQLDGELQLKKDSGTQFIIKLTVAENH